MHISLLNLTVQAFVDLNQSKKDADKAWYQSHR